MRPIRRRAAKKPFPLGFVSEGEADTSDNGDSGKISRPQDTGQVVAGFEQLWGEEERGIYASSLHFNANVSKPIRRFITDVVKEAALPEPWTAWRDDQGRWFFHNRVTGESRWPHPLTPIFKELTNICSQIMPMSVKERDKHLKELHGEWTQRAKQELRQWQEAIGEDGQRKYFYNTTSREASHHHPDSTVLPGHRCRLQALAMLNSPGYVDQIQQVASPSGRGWRSPHSALRTARAIDRLILDSEQSSGGESTTSEGRKGTGMPQEGPVLLAEDARRKTISGSPGGLPVKSWMKVETYGQTCLNLRPEDPTDQRIMQILRPVLDQELPWPWLAEEERRDVFSRHFSFRHSLSQAKSETHPMQSFHLRMVDMLRKVNVLAPREEELRPALRQLMEDFEQGAQHNAENSKTNVQLEVTSSLALALIGCRIIAQQLGMAAMDCPINPWGRAAEVVKKHPEWSRPAPSEVQDTNVSGEVPPDPSAGPVNGEVHIPVDDAAIPAVEVGTSAAAAPSESALYGDDTHDTHDQTSSPVEPGRPDVSVSGYDEPLRRAEMRAEEAAAKAAYSTASPEASPVTSPISPSRADAAAQTSISGEGLPASSPGGEEQSAEVEELSLDEQLKEMCALIQAMRSQQEAAEIEADFTDTLNLCDPQPNDTAPNDIALTTVSQPKSEVISTMQNTHGQRGNIIARSATGDLWRVPAPGFRRPAPPDGSPPNSVRRRHTTPAWGSESLAWSGGFGGVAPAWAGITTSPPLQEPSGPQNRPVPRQLPQGPAGSEPRLWPDRQSAVLEQPEPEVALSPCSTRATTRLHGVERSQDEDRREAKGVATTCEPWEAKEVVLELQQLREQVKEIKEALSPEALQKQVKAVLPGFEPHALEGQPKEPRPPVPAQEMPPKEEEPQSKEEAQPVLKQEMPPKEEPQSKEEAQPVLKQEMPPKEEEPQSKEEAQPVLKQVPGENSQASVQSRNTSASANKEVAHLREELRRLQQQAEASAAPNEALRKALEQNSQEMAELKASEEARVASMQMELEKQKQVAEKLTQQMSQNEADIARRAEEMSNAMEKKLEQLRESADHAARQAHEVIMRSAEHEMRRQQELKAQRELRWRAEHRELQLKAEMTEMRMRTSWQALQQLEDSELMSRTPGSTPSRSRDRMPRSHSSLKEALHYAAFQEGQGDQGHGPPAAAVPESLLVEPLTCQDMSQTVPPQEPVSVTLEFTNESLDDARLAQRVAQDLAPRICYPKDHKEKPPGSSHPSRPGTPVRSPFSARSVCSTRSAQAARSKSTLQLGAKRPHSASSAGRPPFDGVFQRPVTWNGVANSVNRWYELQRRAEGRWYDKGQGRLIRGFRG